jgi:ribosomal protein S18 acetylase RimI-like enzyme
MPTDADLYRRGAETLLASFEVYARGTEGASLQRLDGVSAAVFPDDPERSIYNNALLERADAIGAMEDAYAGAGVKRFAAWVHDSDAALAGELERRGYVLDTSTRVMAMSLDELSAPRPELEAGAVGWAEHLRMFGLPPDLLAGADLSAFRVVAARRDGENVAGAIALDHRGDCGIYNVGTLEPARRRGLATALMALMLHDAVARGCSTASVQSTPMAEGVYAAVGFRDLGRFLEYMPSPGVDGGHV